MSAPAPTGANRTLKLLHLEDSPLDHDLAMAQLARGGLRAEVLRIETEPELRRQLAARRWDLVLSDYDLPGFDGLQALQIVRDLAPELPFVLLSGQIGEDAAVAAMRSGADDYLLKANLARLVPAIEHAVAAADERRARRDADLALAASRKQLSELAQHLQSNIERERAAIAREIHDDVGGALTAIKFDLAWIGRHVDSAAVQQRIASALETVAHAVEASQRIMHNLRPAILDQGLVPALQWLAGRFERRSGVGCLFRTSHDSLVLPTGVPLVAYRFAQEALTNVSKHAGATRVTIDLTLAGGVLSLEVADDGRGLVAADLAKSRSFGLRGLRERATTVGGWVEVSSDGAGTTLLLSVPVGGDAGADAELADDDAADHDPSVWGA
jgi:signal transduction histidine kinase